MTVASKPMVIEPKVFRDPRGAFFEAYRDESFRDLVGEDVSFVQDNHSRSVRNVLRGLHYQLDPVAQGKLVTVVRGAAFDVAVDIRRSSPTFGEWTAVELTEDNFKSFWVPVGFAHGFLALSDPTDLRYKVTEYYSPEYDRTIRWDDPDIGIEWPLDGAPILSEKDESAPFLQDADLFS
jgi:dTDP-4-dehydrorhamnose 3,5-epimerase